MKFVEAIRLALAQIRVQKLKSFFTLLGVTIGVMFLIAVVSIVEGMSDYMEHDFVGKIVGLNTVTLRKWPEIGGDMTEAQWRAMQRWPRIMYSDVQPVVSALPAGILYSVEGYDNVPMQTQWAKPRNMDASAVEGDYFRIRNMKVESGRLITQQEFEMGNSVLVIGQEVAKKFFPNLDPLGREIKVAGRPYTVVGVAESQGNIFGISLDRFVIAPYRSPLRHAVNRPGVIDALKIKAEGDQDIIELEESIRQVMRGRHGLRPSEPDNFSVETSESALSFWTQIKSKLEIAAVVLPAVGLIVGAIVIMNIMLVAVAERTREIGIRKALGAKRSDILAQFLVEAATLSTIGAMVGIIGGILLSQLIAAVSPLPASVAPWSIVVGVVIGAGVGIISGIYPASRASLLDPVAALRQE
jgi:putative ABC transport system permease protein